MHLRLIPLILLLSSCATGNLVIQSQIKTLPQYPINPAPQKFLLLNTFDVRSQKFRGNKDQLFISLLDSTLHLISEEIRLRADIDSKVMYGLTHLGNSSLEHDSLMRALMVQNSVTHAIITTFFYTYFDQTSVVVTQDQNGKNREASYDIVSEIHYSLYDEKGIFKDIQQKRRRFHSSRQVASGLLAAGPNIIKNKDDVLFMTKDNVVQYLNQFLPGHEDRMRMLFTSKELTSVKTALANNNYSAAITESLRFVNHPDIKVAAKANYNCAVLLEKKNEQADIRSFLEESLRLYELPEARYMMSDYKLK